MEAKSKLPRLRRNILSGNVFIEFASPNGLVDAIHADAVIGIGEYRLEECGQRYGLLRFGLGGAAFTKHNYAELCDLICPDVIEEKWS